jgi:hypothetical protein
LWKPLPQVDEGKEYLGLFKREGSCPGEENPNPKFWLGRVRFLSSFI